MKIKTTRFGTIDINKEKAEGEALDLDTLLMKADILTLHASGNHQIIGAREIELFSKEGAILIQTARGGQIDENALYNSLTERKISFAALDVFESEPYRGNLKNLDNVILTPHVGSYALEARIEMEKMAVENLFRGLGETTNCG